MNIIMLHLAKNPFFLKVTAMTAMIRAGCSLPIVLIIIVQE